VQELIFRTHTLCAWVIDPAGFIPSALGINQIYVPSLFQEFYDDSFGVSKLFVCFVEQNEIHKH